MDAQGSLFDFEPRYCIDTNVIVSFLRGTDDEHYGADVFAPQWALIERLITSGVIVAPRRVERELTDWRRTIPSLKGWLKKNRHMFRDVQSSEQLVLAKRIVNQYPVYGSSLHYLGDLEAMTLAAALGIALISLEHAHAQPSQRRPKIPNVCKEFGIEHLTLPAFLRREGFGS